MDAPRPLTIQITPTDVKKGDTKHPGGCAAAQSILREVDGCTEFRVHLGYICRPEACVIQTGACAFLRNDANYAFETRREFSATYAPRPAAGARGGLSRAPRRCGPSPRGEQAAKLEAGTSLVTGARRAGGEAQGECRITGPGSARIIESFDESSELQ